VRTRDRSPVKEPSATQPETPPRTAGALRGDRFPGRGRRRRIPRRRGYGRCGARVRLFHGFPDGTGALIPPRVLFEAARVESKLGQLSKQMGVAATVAEAWAMMIR
jgi:hypothetical protein